MRAISAKMPAFLVMSVFAAVSLAACGSTPFSKKESSVTSESKAFTAAPRMGVNSFLWRASLETLEFMPLEQVDPFGGVILTDWYASPEAPDERFKANVYILDANLRADALKTSIFKQVRNGNNWTDAPTDADTARQIENAILTRARELFISTVDN
ncbi:MAG: DUF3576 domain-containing protein [Maricaulaceae bacterium]